MSINVERIGSLIVQHYVEEISERRHCRLISLSDTFGPDISARGKVGVLWEFFIEPIDATKTKFINHVEVKAVLGFEDALRRQGVTLEQARQRAHSVLAPHNTEETLLFAKDIERKALDGRWRCGRENALWCCATNGTLFNLIRYSDQSPKAEFPMRQNKRTLQPPAPAAMYRTTIQLPTSGYALIVDGQVKTESMTRDHALTAAGELKRRFPMLQIKIYDAENKRSEEMELAAA
jgi:hypothetical protein